MGMSFCVCLPNFVQIGPSATELWRHIHFSRWRLSAILNYFKVTEDHPRSANGGPRSALKFRLDRNNSFGDNAIFVLWGFGLNLPIYMVVSAAHAQNEWLIYFRGRNWPHILIWGVDLPICHPTCKGVAGRLSGVYWWSPHVKARFEPKFSVPSIIDQNFSFWRKWAQNVKDYFRDPPKGTSLRETTFFDVLIVIIGAEA